MNFDRNKLLAKISGGLDDTCASKATTLLLDSETKLVDGAPTREAVVELLPTLKARRENSQRTGKLIYGLDQAIANLQMMTPKDVVFGYGLISPSAAGNIYLSSEDGGLLGVALVDR